MSNLLMRIELFVGVINEIKIHHEACPLQIAQLKEVALFARKIADAAEKLAEISQKEFDERNAWLATHPERD